MNSTSDIAQKRYLLSTIRLRFAPEVQQLREAIIDSIVGRILGIVSKDKYYSAKEIQNIFSASAGIHILYKDVANSLQRLAAKGTLQTPADEAVGTKGKTKKKELYRLSTDARRKQDEVEQEATRRFNSVVLRLFENSKEGYAAYVQPFLKFLSSIFSRLAEEYIQMLRGDISYSQLTSSQVFSSTLRGMRGELTSLDPLLFERAATSFFRDATDPEYAAVKWDMAQNYYILRVIGVSDGSSILAKEVFGGAIFYLDTNIVVSALAPEESHHAGFLALCKACKRIGAQIRVCAITFDELDRLVMHYRDLLEKTIKQIPEDTMVKVTSDFYEIYYAKEKSGQQFDIDAVFTSFTSARRNLKESFDIELEDDYWFEDMKNDAETRDFADTIAARYSEMRPRKKNELAAIHDSMCLRWVEKARHEGTGNSNNIWFLTRDYTLTGCVPPECRWKSLAITLDGLLQWLSPIAIGDDEIPDIALAYSALISSRILPQERIFDLDDFLIFHELHMQCKELPAEDVEGCIAHIKVNAPMLNPTEPGDREKLSHIVASYFADPSRKYKEDIERYERSLSQKDSELEKEKKSSAKKDAWLRLSRIAILFLIFEMIALVLAGNYGAGENLLQKIVDSWPFLAGVVPVCLLIGAFYIGKHRIKALGWPITRIFRHK